MIKFLLSLFRTVKTVRIGIPYREVEVGNTHYGEYLQRATADLRKCYPQILYLVETRQGSEWVIRFSFISTKHDAELMASVVNLFNDFLGVSYTVFKD
jgi:hypothetical protein